ECWVEEAKQAAAKVLVGGERKASSFAATLMTDVKPQMRISGEELFGPAVAVTPAGTIEEAISLANDTHYGLSAGIFTQNLDWAMKLAREVDAANVSMNWGPKWRADVMPYASVDESRLGREGSKSVVKESKEIKIILQP